MEERGQELTFFISLHTQPVVLKTFYSFLLLLSLIPDPKAPAGSGGGSVLRSPGVRAQGQFSGQWGKTGAFPVSEASMPEDRKMSEQWAHQAGQVGH